MPGPKVLEVLEQSNVALSIPPVSLIRGGVCYLHNVVGIITIPYNSWFKVQMGTVDGSSLKTYIAQMFCRRTG